MPPLEAQDQEPQLRQSADVYCCDFGDPPHLYVSLDVIEGLAEEFAQSDGSVESGGLLLGRAGGENQEWMEVWDYLPLREDDGSGRPCLFDQDVRAFLKGYIMALRRVSMMAAVGYYRKFLGRTPQPTESDVGLCRSLFSDSWNLVLLISSRLFGPPAARFCFWDGTKLEARKAWPQFPLDRHELAGDAASWQRFPSSAGPLRRLARMIWASAAIVAVLLIASIFLFRSLLPPPEGLQLTASRLNQEVHIRWSRPVVDSLGATTGLLSIRDGGEQREVALNAWQLRNARFEYGSANDDVEVSLKVFSRGHPELSENFVVPAPPKPPEPITVIRPRRVEPQTGSGAEADDTGGLETQDMPATPEYRRALLRRIYSVLRVTPAPQPRNTSVFSPPVRTAPSPVVFSPPVKTAPNAVVLGPPQELETHTAAAGPLPSPLPGLASSLGTAKPVSLPVPETKAPAAVTFVPAQVIERVQPAIAPQLRRLYSNSEVVDVRVTVNERGTVVSAEPVAQGKRPPAFLIAASTDAARHWRFVPAKSGETPVASTVTLTFKFQ